MTYVDPPTIANQTVGSQFTVSIKVANMSFFIGWDIFIVTNNSVITPVNMSITGNLFQTDYHLSPNIVSECINGVLVQGSSCNLLGQPTGPGVAHLVAAVVGLPNETPPVNGLLFTLTYQVATFGGGSRISFSQSTLINGTPNSITPNPQGGIYGTIATQSSGISIAVQPKSLIIGQGSSGTANVSLTSLGAFSGQVSLNVTGILGSTILLSKLNLAIGGANSTVLTLTAPSSLAATSYPETVTASSGSISNSTILTVTVQPPPFFVLGLDPSLLRIHAGDSGNTTINLLSYGFTGNVGLAVRVRGASGLVYSLGTQIITLRPGPTPQIAAVFTTSLNVSTPPTSLPFTYYITVIATSSSQSATNQTLVIIPPLASLSVSVSSPTLTVRAGDTRNATITLWSVDYFWGFAYVSAVMNGGTVAFDHDTYFIAPATSAQVSYTPSGNYTISVKIGQDAIPGNYVLLLTVYSINTASVVTDVGSFPQQKSITKQVAVPITIEQTSVVHTSSSPVTILGLAPVIYFGILGGLSLPLIFLAVRAYRNREEEDESWRS